MATTTVPAFNQTLVIGGDHAEKPRRDPMKDRVLRSDLLARFGWSEADADGAREFGFPPAQGRVVLPTGLGQSYYSNAAVTAWAEAIGRLAARVAPTPTTGRVKRALGLGGAK